MNKQDSGKYTCRATSNRGKTEAQAFVRVASPSDHGIVFMKAPDPDAAPAPPPTPTITSANGTMAHLIWSPPSRQGASAVKSYSIEYYNSSGGSWTVAAKALLDPEFTLTLLNPQSSYGVIVRARNYNGISEPSGIAEVGGEGAWAWRRTREAEKLQQIVLTLNEASATSTSSGPATASLLWKV